MKLEDVKSVLAQEPFVPLKLVKTDGTSLDIPFKHVAVPQRLHLLVFKGVKHERSRHATKGFEAIGYDYIDRIEPKRNGRHHPKNGGQKGRGKK
jgi:hypothetical protein